MTSQATNKSDLTILMISLDRKVFEEGSDVRERLIEQGRRVKELRVIVFALRSHGLECEKIAPNIWLYPTDSLSRWLYPLCAYRIGRMVKNVDVVTTQDPSETGIVGLWLSRAGKSRLQVQVHTDLLSSHYRGLSLLNRFRIILARYVLKKADCIRVVGEHIKRSLMEWEPSLESRTSVLPVYVDAQKLKSSSPKELHTVYPQFNYLILVVSRFESEKNVALSLRAFAHAQKKENKIGLLILGEGSEHSSLVALTKTLGIENSVIFLGWVNDVASYYRGVDLVLNTSNFEGYGRSIVEARIVGTPVISTDVGVAREVGADIVPSDPKVIGEHIVEHKSGKVVAREPYTYPYDDRNSYFDSLIALWTDCCQQ